MKFSLFGTTYILSLWPGWRWSVSDHEYWRRYCAGPVYLLRFHPTHGGLTR